MKKEAWLFLQSEMRQLKQLDDEKAKLRKEVDLSREKKMHVRFAGLIWIKAKGKLLRILV